MIDGPRSRPAPPPPPPPPPRTESNGSSGAGTANKADTTSAPATTSRPASATSTTGASRTPDSFEARDAGPASAARPVDKGQEAAQQAVTVSDQDVRNQREEVRTEGREYVEDTRTDLLAKADEIRSHEGDDNYQVEIEERDGETIYRERYIGEDNSITRETYLEVSDDQPPKVLFEETRQNGDNWVQERKEVEGSGDDFKAEAYEINTEEYPGSPSNMDVMGSSVPSYDPQRISQKSISFESDGGDVSKNEQELTFGDFGQVETTRDASASFKETSGEDVDLPGGIDDAFADDKPVIESNIRIASTDAEGNEHVIANEHRWSQDKVRVSEQSGEDKATTLLLEQQSDDGKSKEAQLFIKGAQETITTRTELNQDGSVTETQKLWDSNEGVVGDPNDDRPELKQSTTTTTKYGEDGHVATQHKASEDLGTGERRVEDFERTVENGVARYQTRQEIIPKDGPSQVTTVDERAHVYPGGEKPFSTTIQGDGHTVEITEDSRGRHYTDTNDKTGEVVRGEVRQVDGGIELDLNGKKLQLNEDGSFKDDDQLDGLNPAEFSAVPFLVTGARGVKGLVDNLGGDASKAEESIAGALKDKGGVDKFRAAGAFFGAASSAKKTLDDIRNGDYLQAALDGTKTGVQGTQLAGSLLGKFEAASKVGKALGVAGGAIDVASGIYGVFKADNDYDRATSGLNIVQGGLGIALALTAASGPAAPFLFAGIVGVEIIKGIIGHAKSEYVPPVAADLR